MDMEISTSQFGPFSTVGIYEPFHQINTWDYANINQEAGLLILQEKADHTCENSVDKQMEHSEDNQASLSISEKMQKRLKQNREAARRSRQRKKAYVQKLELSRLKLAKLQLQLEKGQQQEILFGRVTSNSGALNTGIMGFEIEYKHWIDEQERNISQLRNALQLPVSETELRLLIQNILDRYCYLCRLKKDQDAYHLVYGSWKTSVELFFLWIGGFRPSTLINVVIPQMESLSEQQMTNVETLKSSCIQTEDALTLGINKLQQTLVDSITNAQMDSTLEKLKSLQSFVYQADHLREQILVQICRILTSHQAARCLLAVGEYFQRMRTLGSLWSARTPGDLH